MLADIKEKTLGTEDSLSASLSSLTRRKEKRITRAPPPLREAKHVEKDLVRGEVTDLPRLQLALKKDMKAHAGTFWSMLRKAVEQKFGKTDVAFQIFSCAKDHVMSCQQFQELNESVGVTLEPRIQKALFEMAMKRESDVALSFQDFQDALLAPKVERLRIRLNTYNDSVRRIQGYVDNFIKRLAVESGEDNRRRAIARLQKKMGMPFCAELRAGLQRYVTRIGKVECAIYVEDFTRVIDSAAVFQHYEHSLLRNVFDRVDRTRCGSVTMSDLVVAFTLLASECNAPDDMRKEKMSFLFTVFDTDGDGCLMGEEILRMYCSIAIHAAIACGDQPSYDADMALGDELSLSKARRLYDFTMLFLQQNGVQELCTFQELWSTFRAYPKVMEELVPGTHSNSIMWVLRPLRPVRTEEAAKRSKVRRKSVLAERGGNSKWNILRRVSVSSLSSPHLATAEGAKQQQQLPGVTGVRPASRSKSLEVNKTERFRVQAAIRFRHALRGEWDVVNSLQSGPPQSREGWFDSSQSKLPALAASGSGSASPALSPTAAGRDSILAISGGSPEKLPHISWSEAASKFDRRQKEGNWQNCHRQSLVNWSKDNFRSSTCDRLAQLRPTRSTPNLKLRPGQTALSAMSAEEVKVAADARIAEITSQEAKILEAAQELISPQRWGKEALTRIKNVARARAAAGSNQSHQQDIPALTDCMAYECQLCHGRHELSVPCLY